MKNFFTQEPMLVSFETIYQQNIAPKLKEIDIYLKTEEAPYNTTEVANLLGMPLEELMNILSLHGIRHIAHLDFFTIVAASSSYICGLIKRQWKYVSATSYTPEIVAYIYELNLLKICAAFEELETKSIPPSSLHEVFKRIYTPVFK